MKSQKFTLQSNQVTLSKISLGNIYEKRLLNAFIDSLSPHLKGKFEEAQGISKGIHVNEQWDLDFGYTQSITYTYKLSDVEPNPQNYVRLKAAVKRLRDTPLDIVTSEGTEIYTGLIEVATINPREEYFTAKLSLTGYQFLCDISKGYSLKNFKTALELKTLYSSCVYELLCKWRSKPSFIIDIEELRFITNTTHKYPSTKDFKKRVLDSAKKELDQSDFTDLTFNYENIKKGRAITGFKIYVLPTKNNNLKLTSLSRETSLRYDFDKEILEYLERNKINVHGSNRELLKDFFIKKGTNLGLDFLEKVRDKALQTSRDNPQGYIIAAVKKHLSYGQSSTTNQTNLIDQISEMKTSK